MPTPTDPYRHDPQPLRPPEPPPYRAPDWQPSERPPFEPPGSPNPVDPTRNPWQRALSVAGGIGVAMVLAITQAYGAAAVGGAAMPWDTPLQNLRDNLTGPTAYGLALIGFVLVMAILIFGGELNHWGRSLCFLILTACVLVGVNGIVSGLGIAGATIDTADSERLNFVLGFIAASLLWGVWTVASWLRRRYRAAQSATAALGDGGLPNQL